DFRAPAKRFATREVRLSCRVIRRAIDVERLIAVAAEPLGEPMSLQRRVIESCRTIQKPQSHQANQPRGVAILRRQQPRITFRISGAARAILTSKSTRPPTPLHAIVRA